MISVSVEISRFIDDHQPGFVECRFLDACGELHTFTEKGPVVSTQNLSASSQYPCPGNIACEVVSEFMDSEGRSLVRIDTERPFSIESTSGETKFVVLSSQLVR